MKRWAFAAIAVLFMLLPMRQALRADQVQYTVEDLGTIDGLVPTITGINASGQVSGFITLPGVPEGANFRAVRYTNGLGWTYLPGLDGHSVANGINAYGELTGYYVTAMGQQMAYRYTDAGGVVDIALPDGAFSEGLAINSAGEVAGWGFAGTFVAFRASPGLAPQVLPSLGDAFPFNKACGINDAGVVAATAIGADFVQTRALRIDVDGTVAHVTPFDGEAGTSAACAIDNDGRLGGHSTAGVGTSHAFRFTTGSPVDVDAFGSSFSKVEAISGGVSVGWHLLADASARAFIHTDANGTRELNTLIAPEDGWVLTEAKAVNAVGQIAGAGMLNGAVRAFRLTPSQTADTTAPVIDRVTASPSDITTPNGAMVPVTVQVDATDNVDAVPSCTIAGIASPGSAAGDFEFTAGTLSALVRAVAGRTYTLSVACSDAAGNTSPAATASVAVADDTTAPVIGLLVATPSRIWPPNGRMVDVQLTVGATDDVDPSPSCTLTGVRGMNTGDAEITGPLSARVRAKKNNDGSDRTYFLVVTCTDDAGNSAQRSVTVTVAKGDGDHDYYYAKLLRKLHELRHDRDNDRHDRDDRRGSNRGRR